jgi:hypothetical protein
MDDSNYAHYNKMHTFTREALQEGETTVLQEHVMLFVVASLDKYDPDQNVTARARHYI